MKSPFSYVSFGKQNGLAWYGVKFLYLTFPKTGLVEDWEPLLLESDNGVTDYMLCELAVRLCSEKLRDVISQNLGPNDAVQWLPVTVSAKGSSFDYYIMHFPNPVDCLDMERSIIVNGDDVARPVFQSWMPGDHRIFTYLGAKNLPWYVVPNVKKVFRKEECTGLTYEPVLMASSLE
ncbi:MAG: hypothetical protein ABJA67_14980 [Chthonomonadales bacterium]